MRGGPATRGQSFSSVRGSNKSLGKSRPYRPQASSWNQSSQVYEQYFNEKTSNNPFGAFDPNNEAIYPSMIIIIILQLNDQHNMNKIQMNMMDFFRNVLVHITMKVILHRIFIQLIQIIIHHQLSRIIH